MVRSNSGHYNIERRRYAGRPEFARLPAKVISVRQDSRKRWNFYIERQSPKQLVIKRKCNNYVSAHVWKKHRKLLNPTFNHKILRSFIPMFNEKTKIMADNLKQMLHQKKMFDISQPFFACTLDTVCGESEDPPKRHKSMDSGLCF